MVYLRLFNSRIAYIPFFIIFFTTVLIAQNSTMLDPDFGENGIVRIGFGTSNTDEPADLLLLSDGKILVGGKSINSFDWFIGMTRILPEGLTDQSGFGTNGKVLLHFVLRDHPNDIHLQPDGKILVAGAESPGNGSSQVSPALYRFESNGTLDTSFADSGKAVLRFDGNPTGEFYGINVLPDGKILAAGSLTSSPRGFGVMRFLPNGDLDSTFGLNGKTAISVDGLLYNDIGCLFLSDTAIVLSTVAYISNISQFIMVMMDSSGIPYSSFGNNGIVITGIPAKSNMNGAIKLHASDNGKIILASTTPDVFPAKFSVFRFYRDGLLDSTFGANGRTDFWFGYGDDEFYDMLINRDRKILLVGKALAGNHQCAMMRLNQDGTPDTTFAPDGKFYVNLNNNMGSHYFTSCVELPDGSVITGGMDYTSNNGDFMIAKFINLVTGNSDNNTGQPGQFTLYQNYPNPFNPSTRIDFSIPQLGIVSLKVYDILGNEISTLAEGYKTAGTYSINFDGRGLASGIYYYRIQAGNYTVSKKMILMK